MNEMVTIENTEMQIREFNGQRVVTFNDIDLVHQRKAGTARNSFYKHKKYFIENVDYFMVTRENPNVAKNHIKNIPPKGITFLTESGYLMLVKPFSDDLSWKVQRQLVNSYFKARELPEVPQLTTEEIVDWKLNDLHKRLKALEKEQAQKPQIGRLHRLTPRKDTWYEKNRNRIWRIRYDKNIELKELYSTILDECSKHYDLDEAEQIYRNETGRRLAYPIDVVEYFPQLQDIANQVLDYFEC